MPAFGSIEHPNMQHGRPYPDPEAAGVCCPRCGRINTPGERRCGRCQSRLVREPIQQTLDLGIRWPKVVSIDWVAPERRPLRSAAARPSGSRKARRARPAPQGQLELDLQPLPELPAARRPLDQPELVPAPLARRAAALLVDGALALTAYGIILAVAQLGIALWSGVNLRWDRPVLIAWAVVLAAVQLGYRCFCVGAGVDSPGLRWMGLRLLRFDRRPPRLRDRWLRFAAGLISTAGLCAGWLWALLSSDRLSWADLISRTCAVRADRSEPGAR